jgi:hypothetical protein
MTETKTKNVYSELSKKLPSEGIQKSNGKETGKGYDTSGYGYQFVVNRLNEILGIDGWSYEYKIIKEVEGVSSTGKPRIMVCVETNMTIGDNTKPMVGGHTSNNFTDALKGALTNAIKKNAAMFGVGKEAYEKLMDEDNQSPDNGVNKTIGNYSKKVVDGTLASQKLLNAETPEKAREVYKTLSAEERKTAEVIEAIKFIKDNENN